MSGREEALRRCFAHEERRRGRFDGAAEKRWLRSLPDDELGEYVRRLNEIDRAVANYRRLIDEAGGAA